MNTAGRGLNALGVSHSTVRLNKWITGPDTRAAADMHRQVMLHDTTLGADTLKMIVLKTHATFRAYRQVDRQACLALFDTNCPEFFAPNEREDYAEFLDAVSPTYSVATLNEKIIGAYGVSPVSDGLSLNWILLAPEAQGLGLGSSIMERALRAVEGQSHGVLHIAASHKSARFFERFGAKEIARTTNGWGPGMHRVDMQLRVAMAEEGL